MPRGEKRRVSVDFWLPPYAQSLIQDDIDVEIDGKTIQDWCHIFSNGTGFLDDWKCEQTQENTK